MPTYSFEHIETGETMTTMCTWEEAQTLVKNGEYRMLLSKPLVVSSTGTITGKIDRGFNDVLTTIKKNNRRSTIQTK